MTFSTRILERSSELGAISEDPQVLTRRYLTPQHRQAAERIAGWMHAAGMAVAIDTLGNVVGRYAADRDNAPVVMTGSHLDSVVNAGRFDGIFGILCAIEAVADLASRKVRLPFAIEVVAFGDEEGVRFGFSMVGSRAFAGNFDVALLDRRDRDGISMRDAILAFGGDPTDIAELSRARQSPAARLAAFIEVHIEQGPVLLDEGLPLGVVTAIAGSTRIAAHVQGLAGHAGTVPMDARRDAVAAAAEMALAVEAHAARRADTVVATVGRFDVAGGGAINVIAGDVDFTIDIRAGDDATRLAAVAAIERDCLAIAARRDVALSWRVLFELRATACDAGLQQRMADSIAAQGITPRHLRSGAGHDAMEMARIAPVAMLFVRCGNGGISHHPDETMTAADADVATRALLHFLERFAVGPTAGAQ